MANSRIMLTCKHCGEQMVLGKGFLGSYRTAVENKSAELNEFFEKHEQGKCSEDLSCSDNARDHFIILEEGEMLEDLPEAWISTKERLPKKNGEYLCYCSDGFGWCVCIHCFAKNLSKVDEYDFKGIKRAGWYSYDGELGYFEQDDVTHWMPLPDAPQNEG